MRLTGAVFFRVEARAPWVIEVPDTSRLSSVTLPRAQHVISYHVVTRGACWGALVDDAPVRLTAGDVLVIPHGDAYVMSIAPGMRGGPDTAEVLAFMEAMVAGRLPFTIVEGGDGPERLELVCGFLGCDVHPFNPLLAALPRVLPVRQAFAAGDPLGRLIELTIAESQDRRAGSECVRLRLSELMFVEVVRRHLAALPPSRRDGWPACETARSAARSRSCTTGRATPGPSRASPGRPASRDPPWPSGSRISSASRRCSTSRGGGCRWRPASSPTAETKVSAVGLQVGYDSEAAFSRAFKKATGRPTRGLAHPPRPAAGARRPRAPPPARPRVERVAARSRPGTRVVLVRPRPA